MTSSAPHGMCTPQGIGSSTWKAPELDGSLLVPELLDHHLAHSPAHTWAVTPAGVRVSNLEFARASIRAGQAIKDRIQKCGAEKADPEDLEITVGVLAEQEAFVYVSAALGAARAGYIPVLLSTRNSVPALSSLLSKTSAHLLLYTASSPSIAGLARATQAEQREAGRDLHLVPMPGLNDLYPKFGRETAADDFKSRVQLPSRLSRREGTAVILHSSGSTNFPKAIRISHLVWLEWARTPWYGADDICGQRFFTGSLPTFHAMGFMMQLVLPLSTGIEMGLLDPVSPPTFPTPAVTLDAIQKTNSNFIIVVPSVIEEWADDPEAVKVLKGLDRVLFGGASLNGPIGDVLVRQGVKLTSVYGATEIGFTGRFVIHPQGKDWSWVRQSPQCKPRFVPRAEGLYELQYLVCDTHHPSVLNLEDVPGYSTNDLVEKSSTDSELFKIVGRSDDQIILATGEKTQPAPLERIIASNPALDHALYFGRDKVSNGVILEPRREHQVRPGDEDAKRKLIDSVWPDIERANAHGPQYSRLFRNLVLVSDPARPFQLTPKGSVKRTPTLHQYADEIEAAYKAAAETTAEPLDVADIPESVAKIVRSVMHLDDLGYDEELVARGMDSLQATQIGNEKVLASALAATPGKPSTLPKLPTNVVFENPSIHALASYVGSILSGYSVENSAEAQAAKVESMIRKYSSSFSAPPAELDLAQRPAQVLVTGTTGGLGSQLLQSLIQAPNVERVFAVNRSSRKASLADRQRASFVARGLDLDVLNSPKLVLIEADLSKPDLFLEPSLLSEIRSNMSHLVHNAWRVNFDISLRSFEPDIIGLKNLLDLAITSRRQPSFLFASSIAAVRNWPPTRFVPEEPIKDTLIAVGQGYGESKYVGEKILQRASEATGIPTTVLRIGQLCGSLSSGSWNSTDWVPSIVKSGAVLGCLPKGEDVVAWLPLDVAGQSIVEMALARTLSTPTHEMLHIVHPHVTTWSGVFRVVAEFYLSRGRKVDLVPYAQWLAALQKDAEGGPTAMERNPATKLLDFFRAGSVEPARTEGRENVEAMGFRRLETKKAEAASPTLRKQPPLRQENVWKWLESWEREGFLKLKPE